MGTSASQHTDLANNEYVLRLVGTESVSPNDPFWNPLLSFTLKPPATSHDDMVLEERVRPICEVLASHNLQSVNFGSLLRVFFSRSAELLASAETDNSMFSWQTYNAMFIIRCYTKYLTRNFKETDVIRHIEVQGVSTGGDEEGSTLVRYVDALVGILVQVPVKDFTYALHCEAINSLLTLLSVQLITAEPAIHLQIFRVVLECNRSEAVTHALLKRYTEQAKPPPNPGGSILVGLASDLWSLLTLSSWGDTGAGDVSPLADKALLLLLVLVNHCSAARITNPYRDALAAFSESLSAIYVALCGTLARGEEPATLLLYQLVHRNATFKTYLLSRADLEQLVLPVLHTVYGAPHSPSHHVYMALIVLLMLTEDPLFNRTVYATMVKGVPWYTERSIPEISLGGLLVLVTTRTAQYNLLKMRDKYLHTNCLAALANMSAQFSQLHPYVCQRIVGLFEVLSRTHARNNHESEVEEALRILLEVLNSCLTHQLIHNTNLVYMLLYKKHVFDPYRGHPAFHDIVSNIDQVIEYFSMKLERAGEPSVDVSEVLAQVQRYALQWRHDRLKKFPELKFKYVEEDKPEEFFIPYVWTLVSQRSGLYWNMELTKC